MIKFNTVRWQNFLSTGNKFTEIKLDSVSTTLIVGGNGAGKSTMLDALSFGLFGKPYRNINKPQLVNTQQPDNGPRGSATVARRSPSDDRSRRQRERPRTSRPVAADA